LIPEQKIIVALCMLTYGAVVDQCDEITRMEAPNIDDLQRLLNRGD
jgi:hypothetical protein